MNDSTAPRGVLFDMDGVLVDSGPAHRESWRILAGQHGVEVSDEEFAGSFGRTSRDILRAMWGDQITDEEIRRRDDEKEAIYRELIAGNIPLMRGAHEMLQALRQAGYKLAVATSGPPENLELVLREGDLARYFAATVSGFDVRNGKPAPDCFLLAAQRAGLQPAGCVVVEDAPVGIQAGIAAGMKVIGFVGTHPAERLQQAGAARIVEQLAEITPGLIGELIADTYL